MRIERDVMVPTRDGAPIAVDVFRPDGDEPVPVIASMSPYGKDVHWPDRFPLYDLVDQNEHMVWETPNPVVEPRGYALVRADSRGTGKSQGRLDLYGPRDAEDFYDVIEWAATSRGRAARSRPAGSPGGDDGLAGRRAAAAAPGRRGGLGGDDGLLPRGRLPGRAVLQGVHRVLVEAADRAAAQRRRWRGLAEQILAMRARRVPRAA